MQHETPEPEINLRSTERASTSSTSIQQPVTTMPAWNQVPYDHNAQELASTPTTPTMVGVADAAPSQAEMYSTPDAAHASAPCEDAQTPPHTTPELQPLLHMSPGLGLLHSSNFNDEAQARSTNNFLKRHPGEDKGAYLMRLVCATVIRVKQYRSATSLANIHRIPWYLEI